MTSLSADSAGSPSNPVLWSWKNDPGRTILYGPGEEITGGQALETVYRLARTLAERGVGPDRAVALFGPVSPRMFLVAHAIQLAGGAQVEVPLNLDGPAQVRLLRECAPSLTVADPDAVEPATLRALEADRPLLTIASAGAGEDLFALSRVQDASAFPSRARKGSLIRVSMTGGTTGRSKPVARSFGAPTTVPGMLGRILSRGDRPPHVLIADRLTGMIKTVADQALTLGGSVTTLPDYSAEPLLAALGGGRVTHTMVPTHVLRMLMDHPDSADTDLSGLDGFLTGGSALSPALLKHAVRRMGPVVHSCYGQTEAGNIAWLCPEDYADGDPAAMRACGRPSPGVEVQVRGPGGQVLAPGERGRVWVRTPLLMDGYLGRPEATARVLREGWLDTEDIGFLDESGLLTLLGRDADAVRLGDITVHLAEIDAHLQEHEGVADSATFDTTDASGAVELHAAVVAREGAHVDEEELRALVRESLGPEHVPASVVFVAHVPHTFSHEPCLETLRAWHRDGAPSVSAPA